MSSLKFVYDDKGMQAIMKSAQCKQAMKQIADGIVANAGEDWTAEAFDWPTRSGYWVHPTSVEAAMKNKKNNTLEKAIGAVRT